MRLGKRERAQLHRRDALKRAQRIKAGRVSDTPGVYAGSNSMAFICANKFTQWGHYKANSWEYNGKYAAALHRKGIKK